MIRDELSRALEILGDRLPDGDLVLLVRRAFGDRGVTFIRGDVERVTGHPASAFEASTERWLEIVHPEDRQTLREQLQRSRDTDETRIEYRVVDPRGGVRWLRERLKVIRTGPGAPPEVVGILRDITFERTARSRISGLEKELRRSRRMEAVGSMTSGIAHDFNNLLTVILASADLLRHDESIPDEAMEDVRVLREAAHRGAELVQQILRFASERRKSVETVRLGEIVEDLDGILEKVVGSRIEVSVELPEESWPVRAHRTHLEQIILNLASNARDAIPGSGELVVRVENHTLEGRLDAEGSTLGTGRYVRLTVRDTGTGMSPDVKSRVFEPFFSTKGESGERSGGFGLPTVLRLVRGYGGGIRVRSEEGRGSEFQIYLPVREETDAPIRGEWIGGVMDAPAPDRARILLVDGDPAVRSAMERILEREGHSVVTAGTAAEGLQAFDRVRPAFDLLVTDVVLPDRSGHDLWRAVRKRVEDLPVVFVSGYDRETMAAEGVTPTSGSAFLRKPLNPRDLRETVARIVSGTPEPGSDLSSASEG
ncbi:MAG: ATP-binding protein [Longimicrobiales bacterium]|nr:ATP-binding protein [Longimicrobiales bacterium]